MTPDERAARDRDEREAWITEQLATAPPLTEQQHADLRRYLTVPAHRLTA